MLLVKKVFILTLNENVYNVDKSLVIEGRNRDSINYNYSHNYVPLSKRLEVPICKKIIIVLKMYILSFIQLLW
jgi:hypothetical protein